MPITFSMGESHIVKFFVTKLDEEYLVVLRYDWMEMKIMFQKLAPLMPMPNTTAKVDIHCLNND